MKRRKNVFLALMLCFVSVIMLSARNVVFAEGDKPDYKLAISPSIDDLGDLKPGSVYGGKFKIYNEGSKKFQFSILYAPYTVATETYEPNFARENTYTEIKDWISVDLLEGELAAGEEREINYSVKVPEDMHGGSQSAAMLVTMQNVSDGSGNIEAVRQLAYIIFGNVDGQVTKTGKILENKVPSFLFNPPIYASTVVENTGNVYTRAKYSLQVFPLFSDEEVYTNEEDPEASIIFPETKRMNQIQWEGAPQLGIFRVRSTVKIFDEESVTEKLVFLCPIWFLFIVLLLIFCIIFWLVSRIFRRKREA